MAQAAAQARKDIPWTWEGTDRKGNRVKGRSLATNETEVRAEMRRQGLVPVKIRKQRQVVETARRLLPRKGFHDVLRFDIVGVYLNDRDEPIRAEHYENAFDAGVLKRG